VTIESTTTRRDHRDRFAPRRSTVLSNRRVGPGWFLLRLYEPEIAARCEPGTFVQILCADDGALDPLLRRPFSVYWADPAVGTYDVLYTTVGRGTRWMAALPDPGTVPLERDGARCAAAFGGRSTSVAVDVDVLGPLGNTFGAPRAGDRVFLVGGGVGVAPLYFLARRLLAMPAPPQVTFCMGARSGDFLQGIEDFRALPIRTEVATDDGSAGFHGRVTELFSGLLDSLGSAAAVQVYGCGPQGMNESLRSIAIERGLRCEICLEALMGCGFGICFGCVAPIRREPAGEFYTRRICWEGPVFDARLLAVGIDG